MEDLGGFENIVAGDWPLTARKRRNRRAQPRKERAIRIAGLLLIAIFSFAREMMQTRIPGRYPDITDVCLAALGWWLPWTLPLAQEARRTSPTSPTVAPSTRRPLLAAAAMIAAAVLLAAATHFFNAPERALDEKKLPQLPAPEMLAAVSLPHF